MSARKPYPHVGGCECCHDRGVCNVCEASISTGAGRRGRCTNGRCASCHAAHCTPGGATAPGHGYGDVGAVAREGA